jgi:peptide deformylase
MSLRKIRIYGDPALRQKAKPVEDVDESIDRLVEEMFSVLEIEGGIGLAATQIGVPLRVIVVSVPAEGGARAELALINPVITAAEGWLEHEEGCLSVPGVFEKVRRRAKVAVEGLELNGGPYRGEHEGLPATVFQHEIDHLDGVLFVDRISPLRRRLLDKELVKIARADG